MELFVAFPWFLAAPVNSWGQYQLLLSHVLFLFLFAIPIDGFLSKENAFQFSHIVSTCIPKVSNLDEFAY